MMCLQVKFIPAGAQMEKGDASI